MTVAGADNIAKLDELLALLTQSPQSDGSKLAQEHLHGARTYLVGAMQTEYRFNLRLALEVVQTIPDHPLRAEIESRLTSLLAANV